MNREIFLFLISLILILQHGISGCALPWDAGSPNYDSDQEEYVVSSDDITLGMTMRDVIHAWGEPRDVYQAGRTHQGNEKWVYPDDTSARWGASNARVVYFEGGRVAGWETTQNSL